MTPVSSFVAAGFATAFAGALALAGPASAQMLHTEALVPPGPDLVEGEVRNLDTVLLLTGLAKIESDLQLGLLFLSDGLTSAEGSHFSRPRAETLPAIRDSLIKAGVADLEPLLLALEAAADSAAVDAAYKDAVGAIMMARSVLQPTGQERLRSIVAQVRLVASEINPTGPTELARYQQAWAMLLVARGDIDLLGRDADPVIANAAKRMAKTMDDIILSMPDPNASGPVAFDPSLIQQTIMQMAVLAG
ncbi:MAG: hypothetical protein B7Z10_03180 [Rhodobacterales bacterium 32-66-7]|nr:MAG: hypothetical protein B7Z10_03180 [Rhodobacterales bacterium 32-66-7]